MPISPSHIIYYCCYAAGHVPIVQASYWPCIADLIICPSIDPVIHEHLAYTCRSVTLYFIAALWNAVCKEAVSWICNCKLSVYCATLISDWQLCALAAAGDSVSCVMMKPVKVVSVDKRLQVFINVYILLDLWRFLYALCFCNSSWCCLLCEIADYWLDD